MGSKGLLYVVQLSEKFSFSAFLHIQAVNILSVPTPLHFYPIYNILGIFYKSLCIKKKQCDNTIFGRR